MLAPPPQRCALAFVLLHVYGMAPICMCVNVWQVQLFMTYSFYRFCISSASVYINLCQQTFTLGSTARRIPSFHKPLLS